LAAKDRSRVTTKTRTASPNRSGTAALEESAEFAPRFGADGLIPVAVTSAATGELLMLAYMNAEALARTIETGEAHFWSRSRGQLWRKGEVSGNTQRVVEMRIDCDQDSLWLKVEMDGKDAACHTGRRSCYYRTVTAGAGGVPALRFIDSEKLFDPDDVYRHARAAKGTLKNPK
jgi:phosphoribosyl-AMP cyclohydrolase